MAYDDDYNEDEDYDFEDGDDFEEDGKVILACEDCDYRWSPEPDDFSSYESTICPMCGSANVVEI